MNGLRRKSGWSGTGFSLTSTRQRWRKRARGDDLWLDQSARGAKANASRLLALQQAHWRIENRLHRRRDVTLGEDACQVRITGAGFRVGCPQRRRPGFDGLAPSAQCGFSDAPFLRSSRGCPAFAVPQAFAVIRVHQKALGESWGLCWRMRVPSRLPNETLTPRVVPAPGAASSEPDARARCCHDRLRSHGHTDAGS